MNRVVFILIIATLLNGCVVTRPSEVTLESNETKGTAMQLGNFSVSLTVKDISKSMAFYQKLGFTQIGGDQEQNWVIMQNGTTNIGLFQGMFERNIITFNPGWGNDGESLSNFTDVRDLQSQIKEREIPFITEADDTTTGPASFIIEDPDGNPILVDQHVSKPQ